MSETKYLFDYSIVIPAYNEETRIIETLKSIEGFLKNFNAKCEIIVINDGSKDKTPEKIADFKCLVPIKKINLERNQGKGNAVKTGVENSQGEFILYTDADNATPIEELTKLRTYINEYDIVIGSRKLINSVVEISQPLHRKIIGRVGSILSALLIKNIKDTQCGFKLIKHDVAKNIFSKQRIKRFGFDMELLAIAQFYNLKIIEIPIRWRNSQKSNFRPVIDTFLTLKDLLVIKYSLLTKKY